MASEARHGDCLEVARSMAGGTVDLTYVDPPFFTQKTHSLTTRDRTGKFEFSDEWESRSEYLEFLGLRLREFHRILKPAGSLFFHCDTNASHHIRCLLDEVFGESMFRSEIIWHYRRWSNSQRTPLASHQTLFFYSKTDAYQYHQLFDDYSPSTNVDQILQRRRRDEHGKSIYARDDAGRILNDGHKNGVPISDVWDIPYLNPKAKERVGYPTQKPILLLERVITLVTLPGDLVFDPFAGSGTTLVAAELLGRHSIGVDVSASAVELARRRLLDPVRTTSELLRKGRDAYVQADDSALAFLHGVNVVPVQRNRGIDALLNAAPGESPILLRVQRPGESLSEAAELLHAAGRGKQPATLVLVATQPRHPESLFSMLPPEVIVVNSLAEELHTRLADRGVRVF